MSKEFEDWLLRGPGESMLGGGLKASAAKERRRLRNKLATPNLFPHIEHEDRAALDKTERCYALGQRMVDRCRNRSRIIKELLPAAPAAPHGEEK